MTKVLVAEDDRTLQDVLRFNLSKEGYSVIQAFSGTEALKHSRQSRPDLILLDIMLPELSGLEVCRILRQETRAPILLLTAKSDEVDKVVGLEMGADDYITKPFGMKELMARLRAHLRRTEMKTDEPSAPLEIAGLLIDIPRHLVSKDGNPLILTPKEYELLVFLARNQGLVFSREQLLEKVWGYDFGGDSRTVDVHIRWLRQKIEHDAANPHHLLTVRGAGYKLEP
jgi:two-component system OmpR family response regulator